MTAWSLLFVPASLALIVLLLVTMSWIEQRVLSPRALIVHSARSPHADPEHAEVFVAGQAKGLLDGLILASATSTETALVEVAPTETPSIAGA
ncbi:MAG: hypothetical protein M3179_05315 [Actinomycetota bacterium]|nr:hypothetical protein [Actinomycetota bacterium]